MSDRLKVRVVDDEDLQVVSAVLQDALIQISDMKYLAAEQRFVLVANRFCWENCSDILGDMPEAPDIPTKPVPSNGETDPTIEPCRTYERVLCGLCFEGVGQVRTHGVDQRERGRILELLHIEREPGAVLLIFAGDTAIRLEGSDIACRVEDMGEPWPTTWRPQHPLGETA
ncbi:MAG TPA: DUF2948 family protein [Alphaproteobacteria bacterium]|nr:DUF2948 family protein [Alphaproteobacteria bacterium]